MSDSIYMILDTSHADYRRYVQSIASIAPSFRPRLNRDGSKALIQVKQGRKGYDIRSVPWVEDARSRSAVVLGTGTAAWARELVQGREWILEE